MLARAVDSVLAQTWDQFEIIISDDGSTDDTPGFIESLCHAHADRIRAVQNPNRGPGPAREAGRQLACGEFIQYLDSDDLLWPRKFEIQIATLREQPGCGAAYGWVRLCPEGAVPETAPYKWTGRGLTSLYPTLLVDRWWNTNAPLWRRATCDAIGPWSDLRYSEDWEYEARAGALGITLAYCAEFVTDQWQHSAERETGSGKWLAPPDRVRFFEALFTHARSAGVALDTPEMRHYSRWVFSHARECGCFGDAESARALYRLALRASAGLGFDMRAYRALAGAIGWERAARWSDAVRAALGRKTGADTRKQSWMRG